MDNQIYVVMGSTGEYSDRTEWPVLAYLNEGDAQECVKRFVAWAMEKGVHTTQGGGSYETRDAIGHEFPGAPTEGARIDYTGIDWYVMPVRRADSIGNSDG